MTGQEARDDAVHWVGDAPTSLHGNGAASFERTTRDPAAVTCSLCRALLAQEARDDEREALAHFLHQRRHPCGEPPVDPDYEFADEVLTTLAPYRKHPEPEMEYAVARPTWPSTPVRRYRDRAAALLAVTHPPVGESGPWIAIERVCFTPGPWVLVGEGER